MEAHNGISAKIVEEAGFEGIWASGLCISASMGVRDSNEASWTQILEELEFMSDATTIPMLLDGDTGYGNFNNMRRLVKKLEQRGISGVCIEDKLFPKTNSYINGERQPLACVEEFVGKIKAGKDTQQDEDFCIVARIEALIAGWGLKEAIRRADLYHRAGADAILIHSKNTQPDEILEFMKEWNDRLPVVIVPTSYYKTPTEVFKNAGVSVVIWANHMLRSAINAMQKTVRQIFEEENLINVENNIATISEVFRLQCSEELEEAAKKYLPAQKSAAKALILAASRGKELGALTEKQPKALLNIGEKPLLNQMISVYNEIGIKDITVVRGYKKEKIAIPNIHYVDNEDYETTQEVYSLFKGFNNYNGTVIVSYGDILFKNYVPMMLLESNDDFNIIVDADWKESMDKGRYTNFVSCDEEYKKGEFDQRVNLKCMGNDISGQDINGEWIGLFKISGKGVNILKRFLSELAENNGLKKMRMSELFNELISKGNKIHVSYIKGHWIDIDDLNDLSKAIAF